MIIEIQPQLFSSLNFRWVETDSRRVEGFGRIKDRHCPLTVLSLDAVSSAQSAREDRHIVNKDSHALFQLSSSYAH